MRKRRRKGRELTVVANPVKHRPELPPLPPPEYVMTAPTPTPTSLDVAEDGLLAELDRLEKLRAERNPAAADALPLGGPSVPPEEPKEPTRP